MRLLIVVPTISGRMASLDRCLRSYEALTEGIEGIDCSFRVYRNSPSSGTGWRMGVAAHVAVHGAPDYVHLTNDDCEIANPEWWRICIETCDAGKLPCPVVRNSDGSLQSAGGQLGAPDDLLKDLGHDGSPVGFTTVPFLSWEQWQRIGMIPTHYLSDVWVSYRGQQLGIPTVLRHGYEITHHLERVGRGAGMSQAQRTVHDRRVFEEALSAAA